MQSTEVLTKDKNNLILITCDQKNKTKSSKVYVMTCSNKQEADNEYEPNTYDVEEYTYDDNDVLKTITIKNEYEYSTKELADKYRSSEEKSAERQNTYSGVKVEINKISDTKFVVNHEYDIKTVDKNSVFANSSKYIDDNNKFSVIDSQIDIIQNLFAICGEADILQFQHITIPPVYENFFWKDSLLTLYCVSIQKKT